MSPSFPEAWGGVTIFVLISLVLSGCIAVQACSYFSRFQKDPLVLKCAVAIIWLGSFLISALGCWILHSVSILGYHLPVDNVIVPPAFSIIVALETLVHFTAQGTYIFRMCLFGQNRYILACCFILVFLEIGFGFTWVGHVAINGTIQEVHTRDQQVEWVITSFFIISAFVDGFITMSVSYQLKRSRMHGFKQTKYLIDRIIRWTISTGMLTSSVAITIVLSWYLNRDSFIWGGMCIFEPCCHAIGLLALLNARGPPINTAGSQQQPLPMVPMPTASKSKGPSSSPETATTVTTAMPHDSNAPQYKVVHIGQAEPQDRDIYNLKSSFPSP